MRWWVQKPLLVSFEVLGPADPVVAVAGEDVVLPCYLKPNISAVDLQLIHSEDPLVHLYRDHEDRNENQVLSYKGRTSLFPEELKNGNISLKVKNVRGSDNGEYKCFVHFFCFRISLVCESKGWYPQPQVVWMDSEGHSLPAGHTETHRDSMDLFIVRRRVIVNKTETNRFTCRVRQQQLNETKETITNIPGDEIICCIPGEMFHRAHPWKVTLAVVFSLSAVCIIGCTVLLYCFVKLRRMTGM
uniref:Ig-like domain-containing protein n=1 Tax=Scleropages formosus TaxID=113540 RepID=A0A8C9S8E9_SCLFO